MPSLKLAALDGEDLAIISANMQDAILRVGDVRYLARAGKLILVANRFDWEAGSDTPTRRRAGLHFDRVQRVTARRIRRDDPGAVLSLLAISFEPDANEPSGTIVLTFSGDGEVRAEVECIEARLEDLDSEWPAGATPRHDLGDDDQA